jgi:hypothetical protein
MIPLAHHWPPPWMDCMPTYDVTPRFEKDLARLTADDRERFRQAVAKLIEDLRRGRGFRPGLRVEGVEGARGVFEMTWSGDGRATFQYGDPVLPGEPHLVWRRVGTHAVLANP